MEEFLVTVRLTPDDIKFLNSRLEKDRKAREKNRTVAAQRKTDIKPRGPTLKDPFLSIKIKANGEGEVVRPESSPQPSPPKMPILIPV